MLILARFIGLVIIGMGTVITLNPNAFKAIINFWKQGKKIYIAGIARLIFGIIFLLAAQRCRLPRVVSILGVLTIIGGIIIFVIGPQRIQTIFGWWDKRPPLIIRLMGFIALSIGALILYSV